IDLLARSLLIQGLPNDIYSLIDSIKTAKDLCDALEKQMRGFEYAEQDRKAAILYEYVTFKVIEGEQLLDTYLRYLQVINDLKKCGYKKDNYELNYKFLNNLQLEWKQHGEVNGALGYKKKAVVVTSDPLALVAEKTKVPQDHDVSSAIPCFFIHVIYAISCLYIRSLSVMLSRISFHVLIRQMVNTRTDTDLPTAVQNALQAMFPGFTRRSAKSFVQDLDRQMLVEIPHQLLFTRGLNALTSKSLTPLRRRQL
nr:hypothetical protein [Tanacetum cinerariifolium]